MALYAFGAVGDVGVDIEVGPRPIDEVAIACRAFGRAEARRLAMLDPLTRAREFRRAWVRTEAAAKCLGTGLALSAAKLKAAYPISYADAFAVASAKAERARLATGDPEILTLPRSVVSLVSLRRT